MGLLKSFETQEHQPCYGNRSVWGDPNPVEVDHIRTPDGLGWHLNRGQFDHWLRGIAVERGACLLSRTALRAIE